MIEDCPPGELSVPSLELSNIADLSRPGDDLGVSRASCRPRLVSKEAPSIMVVSGELDWSGVDGSIGRSSVVRWILLSWIASSEKLSPLYLMHLPVVIMSCTWAWRRHGDSMCVFSCAQHVPHSTHQSEGWDLRAFRLLTSAPVISWDKKYCKATHSLAEWHWLYQQAPHSRHLQDWSQTECPSPIFKGFEADCILIVALLLSLDLLLCVV